MNNPSILIIEDDHALAEAYKLKFEMEHFEVHQALDGQQAIEMLKQAPPQIILLDLALPWISGTDILIKIRETEGWKDVPVIVLSNMSSENDVERVKKIGITDYIVKANVGINDVVARVKAVIGTAPAA